MPGISDEPTRRKDDATRKNTIFRFSPEDRFEMRADFAQVCADGSDFAGLASFQMILLDQSVE